MEGTLCALWVHGRTAREVGATCRLLGTSFTVRGWTAGRTFLPRLAGCDSCSDPPVPPSIITVPAPSTTPSDFSLNYPPPSHRTWWLQMDIDWHKGHLCKGLEVRVQGGVLWVLEWGGGQQELTLGGAAEWRVLVLPGLEAHASQHVLPEGTDETWPLTGTKPPSPADPGLSFLSVWPWDGPCLSLCLFPHLYTWWETHLRKLCQLPDLLSLLQEVLVWKNSAVFSRSVMSSSLRPHGLQSTRLLCPWGFSRQEYWSGLPCPPPEDLPNPGIEPRSPPLQADSLPSEPPGKPCENRAPHKKTETPTTKWVVPDSSLEGQGPRPGQPHSEPLDPGPCLRLGKWLAGSRLRMSRRKECFPSKLPGT